MQQINILKFLQVFTDNNLLNSAINVLSSQLGWNNCLLWSALKVDEDVSNTISRAFTWSPHCNTLLSVSVRFESCLH